MGREMENPKLADWWIAVASMRPGPIGPGNALPLRALGFGGKRASMRPGPIGPGNAKI